MSALPNVVPFPTHAVIAKGGHAVTTSLAVAKVFGRQHKDVLKAIYNLDCSPEFNRRNFAPVDYIDEKGESRPAFEITKDGMSFLVMGFHGPKAARFKEAYIAAFNALEARLQANAPALLAALLAARPAWAKIHRYLGLGLSGHEIARLLGCDEKTVRRHKTRMSACGLLNGEGRTHG